MAFTYQKRKKVVKDFLCLAPISLSCEQYNFDVAKIKKIIIRDGILPWMGGQLYENDKFFCFGTWHEMTKRLKFTITGVKGLNHYHFDVFFFDNWQMAMKYSKKKFSSINE